MPDATLRSKPDAVPQGKPCPKTERKARACGTRSRNGSVAGTRLQRLMQRLGTPGIKHLIWAFIRHSRIGPSRISNHRLAHACDADPVAAAEHMLRTVATGWGQASRPGSMPKRPSEFPSRDLLRGLLRASCEIRPMHRTPRPLQRGALLAGATPIRLARSCF